MTRVEKYVKKSVCELWDMVHNIHSKESALEAKKTVRRWYCLLLYYCDYEYNDLMEEIEYYIGGKGNEKEN